MQEKETEKKPKMKKVKETVTEWKQVNSLKAIWTRSPKDITEEEYNNFFKAITKDDKGSLRHIHFKAEGELAFKSILYVPKKCPDGYYDRFYEKSTSLKLYVRKVLISEEFEDFMPRYLSFIKGVVDSDDLPLNVNRETLAQSRVLKVMGQKLTRKALEMLKKMANEGKEDKEDKEKEEDDEEPKTENVYDEFWGQFGKSIKLGILDDRGNKVALAKLLRYATNKSNGKLRGLQEYITDMPAKQKFIYFVTGENLDAVKSSPFLERATKKGYEVLLMTDPLDEYVVQQLSDFDGKKLASLTKDGELFDDNQDKQKVLEEEYKDLTSWLKGVYGDKVEKVSVSTRLSTSPVVLVTSKYGWSANMERIMKAQTFTDAGQHQYMFGKKTMEINPRHPIIKELKKRTAEDPSDSSLTDLANLLYDSATVSSGFQLNPAEFATRINRVLSTGLKIDPSAMVEEEPEEEPASEEESSDQSSESAPTDTTKEDLLQDILSKVEREGHEDL